MPLDDVAKKRALAIYRGIVEPEDGMERHFLRVCRGDARPATADERAWHRYVTDQAHLEAQEAARKIASEVALRVARATQHSSVTIADLEDKIEYLESVLQRQQSLIQSLLAQLEVQKKQLRSYQKDEAMPKLGGHTICPNCGGDGGVNGGCFKCDGSGWFVLPEQSNR